MPKISKADKQRRYRKINRLIKKYHVGETTMPEVYAIIRTELNVGQTTIYNAIKSK